MPELKLKLKTLKPFMDTYFIRGSHQSSGLLVYVSAMHGMSDGVRQTKKGGRFFTEYGHPLRNNQ